MKYEIVNPALSSLESNKAPAVNSSPSAEHNYSTHDEKDFDSKAEDDDSEAATLSSNQDSVDDDVANPGRESDEVKGAEALLNLTLSLRTKRKPAAISSDLITQSKKSKASQ